MASRQERVAWSSGANELTVTAELATMDAFAARNGRGTEGCAFTADEPWAAR